MTKVSTLEARKHFSEVVNEVAFGKQRKVLTRNGKELLALIPMEDLQELLAFRRAEDELDIAAVRKARKMKGKNISLADMKKKLGL